MTRACRVCLERVHEPDWYHARCLKLLFGATRAPRVDLDLGRVHTAALAMLGHTSLSGVQKKISVNLTADRETLQVVVEGGRYILKPQTETFPGLAENEHVTTRLAGLVGIETAPSGLVALADGSLAFISKRFDRLENGRKAQQEDFCQLAQEPPKNKYEGSAELCVRLLRRYATEPLIEIAKLYRLVVFAWWSGNGDMHLKNFSVLTDETGIVRLTPAYDLLCSHLVIPDDPLPLPVLGKRANLTRANWLEFAEYCGIRRVAAERVLRRQVEVLGAAQGLIASSYLPEGQKSALASLVQARTAALMAQ